MSRFGRPVTYWRDSHSSGVWHCYRKNRDARRGAADGYIPMCGDAIDLSRIGGQALTRPEPVLRCSGCDSAEIRLFKRDESLPMSAPQLRGDS